MSDNNPVIFTSSINWLPSEVQPDDGEVVLAILLDGNKSPTLQRCLYEGPDTDCDGTSPALWTINEGCREGDEFDDHEVLGWADESAIAEDATNAALAFIGSGK